MIFRYLTKELLTRFAVILSSLYVILLVSQVFRISSLISSFGFSFANIFEPLFYVSITYLDTLIPIAFFLSVLVTVLKLSETEELIAILSSGQSLFHIARPMVLCAFLCLSVSLVSANYFEAWGKKKILEFIEERALGKIRSVLMQKMQEDIFVEIFQDHYLYADKVSENKRKYEHVVLAPKRNRRGSSSFFIAAAKGESIGVKKGENLVLKFYDGTLYQLSSKKSGSIFAMKFETFEVDFFSGIHSQMEMISEKDPHAKALNSYEIYKTLSSENKIAPEERRKLSYLIYQRNFSPLLILAFVFWGIVLGIYNTRQEKSLVFLKFFTVFFSSTALSALMKWLCEEGYTPASLLVPLVYILFTAFAFFILHKKNSQALWEPLHLKS